MFARIFGCLFVMSKKCKEIRNRFDNTTIMKILGENTSPVVDSEVLLSGRRGGGGGMAESYCFQQLISKNWSYPSFSELRFLK